MKCSEDADPVATALRAAAHPVRLRVLDILARRGVCSPGVLTSEVDGVTLPVVSYHVHVLAEAGLIAPAGTARRRGSVAHFYRLADEGRAVIAAADVLRERARTA